MSRKPLRAFRKHISDINDALQPFYKTIFVVYVAASLIANILAVFFNLSEKFILLWAFGIATIYLALVFSWSTFSEAKRRRAGRLRSSNPTLLVLDDANLFHFHKDGRLTWECKMTVRACSAGSETYNAHMSWRGSPKSVDVNYVHGGEISFPEGPGTHGTDFHLIFPRTLQKGDVHSFSFSITLPNTNRQLSNFLRYARPYVPDRSLTLSIEVEGSGPTSFKRSIHTEITGKGARTDFPEEVRLRRYDWEIEEKHMDYDNIFFIEWERVQAGAE